MKRKISMILAIAMVLCLCLSLAACGSSSSSSSSDTGSSSSSGDSASTGDTASSGEYTDTYTLIFTNHDSSTSVGELYCETVLQEISDACGGRIEFQYNPGGSLFGGGEAVEAVRSGLADLCWNATSITVGVFPISEYLNVPLQGIATAQVGSKILMEMYETMPEVQDEWDEFYVVELQGNCEAPFSFASKKVETASDFSGLSIRTAGTAQSAYVSALGASVSSMGTSEVYEAMSKGVVQGMTNDWHNIDCFSLYETVKYCMDYAVNTTSCFIIMNKDTYNNLDPEAQAAFDSHQNYASDMAGYYWDSMRFVTGDKMEELGVEIYTPSDELYAYMTSDELTEQMVTWFIEYMDGFGYDGQAIYDTCSEIAAKYIDEYSPENVYDADNPFYYTEWEGYDAWVAANG